MFNLREHQSPDIARLRQHVLQPDWPYQELYEAELLNEAVHRWSLLASWAAGSEEHGHDPRN